MNKTFWEYENRIKVLHDDVLTTRNITNNSIDLIVTSPPYNVDIKYNSHSDSMTYDDYLEFSEKWMSRCYQWLKKDGRFCLNIPLDKNKGGQQSVGADLTTIAKNIGFKNLSLDLIYNYQGDTKELLASDIEQAFSLPIDHISAYELTIESHTPFASTPEVRVDDEEIAFFVAQSIEARGFEQYEISNFGRYHSRHNLGYWELDDYIGIGAGAVGFCTDTRYYPSRDIESYIANPLEISTEHLTTKELLMERIFLGLRSSVGIETSILTADIISRVDILIEEQKLRAEGSRVYSVDYFIADEVALFLLG